MPALPTLYNSRFLKADRRLVSEAAGSRTYQTTFAQARLDDIFLAPGATLRLDPADLTGPLLLLPIVGGALLTAAHEAERALLPGCLYAGPAAGPLTLTNPFERETVNVLLIRAPVPAAATPALRELLLPLTASNVLVAPEGPGPALPVRVGLFDSRVPAALPVDPSAGGALCYVINGSFEIEDRLVEHRDALLLWDTAAVELESLADTALLLYLEISAA